ncbi:MAG: ADP-ribosylation factor-like protein [Candidatus Hodarchaeales archaeon]
MTTNPGIYSLRIIDLVTGSNLIKRTYNKNQLKDLKPDVILSTIISFTKETESREITNTFLMKNRKVVMETNDSLAFIIVVSVDYEVIDAKRILSHVRASFLRQYPVKDCEWQFSGEIRYFADFEEILDQIVNHFGDRKSILKFVLIGREYVGKTTLTHAFAGSDYRNYIPTLGLDILRIEYKNYHIRLWDLGGQRQFRKLWPKFATEASGIIFVIDSTTTQWVETREVFELAKLFQLPIIVFANKQDLVDRAQKIEIIAEKLGIPERSIVKGSALLNEGVFVVLDRLLEVVS